jgi:sugar (pentulose or hexulose) kinase
VAAAVFAAGDDDDDDDSSPADKRQQKGRKRKRPAAAEPPQLPQELPEAQNNSDRQQRMLDAMAETLDFNKMTKVCVLLADAACMLIHDGFEDSKVV